MKDIDYLKKYLEKDKLIDGIEKLKSGIPVQYIVGNVDFHGITINVNKNVLIPRFETELLVEKTINYVNKYLNKRVKIIDLGTGSGAIAITLKKKLFSLVDAIDISDKALSLARENAKMNNLNINFYKSDMLENVEGKYDLIISNPPYISYDEKIDDIVKNNEPSIALYAGNDGLEYYIKILKNAYKHINKPGIIAFEIGMTQKERIVILIKKYIKYKDIKIEKDLTGKDRFVFIFV